MSYSKKDILTSISLMFFIISFAIVFTVFFKPLYYSDIYRLSIDVSSGYSIAVIKENYDILISYQSIFYQGPLVLKDFVMSEGGRIHFEEVKIIFEIVQMIMAVSFCTSLFLVLSQLKKGEFRFFRLTAIITVVLPLIIAALAAIDFDQAFILFHKVVFRNDYWIFDAVTDPIINILPQDFFMHCLMMIIGIVIAGVFICYGIYIKMRKHYLKTDEM